LTEDGVSQASGEQTDLSDKNFAILTIKKEDSKMDIAIWIISIAGLIVSLVALIMSIRNISKKRK